MRARLEPELLEVAPGAVASVSLDIANTSEVIDGVGARVIGLDEQYVTTTPKMLPLFPDARGKLQVALAVPAWFPAGRRQVAVEVQSHGALEPSVYLDLNLDVAARPGMWIRANPKVIRTRRTARFVLQLHNDGNVPLEIGLRAVDIDRECECTFSSNSVRVDPGTSQALFMTVRCPRKWTGGEIERQVTVEAVPVRLDLPPDTPPTEADRVSGPRAAIVHARQRPVLSRGVMTALVLASIVAAWAGAFLLGLAKVFASDPLTKDAPASFFVKPSGDGTQLAANLTGALSGPAGSVPKNGQVPAGIGGEISGTVRALSDNLPVGRVLVQAVRIKNGSPTAVSSAATQSDGTYTLAGLFPINYYLKFSSPGYKTVWYPSAPSWQSGETIATKAQFTVAVKDVVITGLPAQITGTVKATGAQATVPTQVVAHPLVGTGHAVRANTAPDGSYTLRHLVAPGTYELTFKAQDYQTNVLTDSVNGGEIRQEPDIVLGAGAGLIKGHVTDETGHGIGGATVTTTVNGKPITVMTPTAGDVGAYTLENLVTPATYVITYSAPGHGSATKVVSLLPGKDAQKRVVLTSGTGSVSGTVNITRNGKTIPGGGVAITVGGATTAAGTPPSTTTLTNGNETGTFRINGLTAPGKYTITATLDGYTPVTVPFKLPPSGAARTVNIDLKQAGGTIKGTVDGPCGRPNCVGDTVSVTDGATIQQVLVTPTGYIVTGLHAGYYTVTVTDPELPQVTALVKVSVGATTPQPFTLSPN